MSHMPEKLKKRVKLVSKFEEVQFQDLEQFPVRYGGTVPNEDFIGSYEESLTESTWFIFSISRTHEKKISGQKGIFPKLQKHESRPWALSESCGELRTKSSRQRFLLMMTFGSLTFSVYFSYMYIVLKCILITVHLVLLVEKIN